MSAGVLIRDMKPSEVESVRLFLGHNGWGHRTGSAEHFAQLIANSQRTALAVKDSRIVGFARGITDGLSNGYLSMVVVCGQHRREGIGRALVEHVMGENTDITWVLRAGREGTSAFFSHLGFEVSTISMERPRSQ
ncbi:GNAT family N-acetyltransferase [Pseudomonas frederiksbergensis]|uniref:GNAT family N-acetyltransferase n=1 Tax=Pseudomonas frederiksbergensis TaxID=104087 RepID=A0A423K9D1_9PSED|nr:GNAT family N-acetyltransferase [Pseudomonas frederiksbergensis]RON48502.1 GNAT family N-acetyltransferase [Pseudomonas frederiksbergensis]